MRQSILSPAGRQPVRIATHVALISTDSSRDKSLTDLFAGISKMIKSLTSAAAKGCTRQNILVAVAAMGAATAFISALAAELAVAKALPVLAVSSAVAIVSLAAAYSQKGGEL